MTVLVVTLALAAGAAPMTAGVANGGEPGDTRARPAPVASAGIDRSPAAAPRSVEAILAEVRRATARYLDLAKAREDGFIQASAMEPRHGYHFVRPDAQLRAAASALGGGAIDLARPPMLLYVERDGLWQLAGVEYAVPSRPAVHPFPGAEWHEHEASCHYRDYRETPAPRAADCPPRHPETGAEYVFWHPALAVVHVWAWYPNPAGPFAAENRYLEPYGGVPAAGHRHRRNPVELAYSTWTHRMAGAILLAMAAVVTWQLRRPRPFPGNALSVPLWIAFGCYLFVTSDPESWPLGPKTFVEIFGDELVLQHKLLALVPVSIGVLEGLVAAGRLTAGAARSVILSASALALTSLLVHFHEGTFRLDAVYLQHAAMAVTGAGLGVTLLVARLARRPPALLVWAWPVFLVALALVLLVYTER